MFSFKSGARLLFFLAQVDEFRNQIGFLLGRFDFFYAFGQAFADDGHHNFVGTQTHFGLIVRYGNPRALELVKDVFGNVVVNRPVVAAVAPAICKKVQTAARQSF